MGRGLNKLTDREVRSQKKPGRHADGGGLYLRVTPGGSRSWVFMTASGGKRSEIGLGAVSALSLQEARRLAASMRERVTLGQNPRDALPAKAAAPDAQPIATFWPCAQDYIASQEKGWKNQVHRAQWFSSLRDHAASLHGLPIAEIGTDDVLTVLRLIWMEKPETAKRLRGRIEKVLDAAKARGLRPRDSTNPAAWKGHLALMLPKQPKLVRGHHAALPVDQAPAFMMALRSRDAVAARCLEFTILTAARSGEALGATWSEIDLTSRVWTVPRHRMKAKEEHQVPLSQSAIDVLEEARSAVPQGDGIIFNVRGAARSNMAMTMLLRRMRFGHVTVHGFRSTFRDWAGETTDFARELVEHALAHTVGNDSERAYRRGRALERRRPLMEAWAAFLGCPTEGTLNQFTDREDADDLADNEARIPVR
jgi:integrase